MGVGESAEIERFEVIDGKLISFCRGFLEPMDGF